MNEKRIRGFIKVKPLTKAQREADHEETHATIARLAKKAGEAGLPKQTTTSEASQGHYQAYMKGRAEALLTVKEAIEKVVKADKRSLVEMDQYAETLTRAQLISLAIAMQSLINNILYEVGEVK